MSIPLRLDPAARDRSHKLYLAACVLGMAASILQPWYLPSCLLFALTALVLGASSFLIRKYHRHLGKAWKTALVCAMVYVLMPVLEPYGFKLFLTLGSVLSLYLCVMFALGGYVKALAGGADEEELFRPPQAAVWFEYCACVYALAYLVADAFPALDFVMTVAAMVSMGFGFAQLLIAFNKLAPDSQTPKSE